MFQKLKKLLGLGEKEQPAPSPVEMPSPDSPSIYDDPVLMERAIQDLVWKRIWMKNQGLFQGSKTRAREARTGKPAPWRIRRHLKAAETASMREAQEI